MSTTVEETSSYVSTSYTVPEIGDGTVLDKDAFLQLLVAQMTNQDPLEPTSNDEFITQMAQLSSYEQMENLNDQFKVNAGLTSISTGASLIGKEVTYTDEDTSEAVTGVVDGVVMTSDSEFVLSIDGVEVSLSSVTSITTANSSES